jgi:hypothetical protein
MSDPADEAYASQTLIELECLYRETRNPKYAWLAFLDFCPPDKPLPTWVRDYLRGCAASWLTNDLPPWGGPRSRPAIHPSRDTWACWTSLTPSGTGRWHRRRRRGPSRGLSA